MNAARQASAQDVVGDGQVQPLVRKEDTSWATGSANPFTYSIEVDPQIIYRWWGGGDKAKANRIYETLCERIADVGMHNSPWQPHKYWMNTGCNPSPWNEVMQHAKEIWAQKYGNPSVGVPNAVPLSEGKLTMRAKLDKVQVWDLTTNPNYKSVKTLVKGETIDVVAFIDFNGTRYYVTQYSFDNGKKVGVNRNDVEIVQPVVVKPEWQRNLKDITPVKLMVLTTQTPIVDLNNGSVVKQLGQGTWVDFTKVTTVGGVEYLISSWSATNAIPNGIKRADVGVPVAPPVNEKPEWLKNWADIADVPMYARADTDLVNFEDGSTIKVISRGTKLDISSTTEWHGHKYAITVYSTDKKFWQGVRIDDLDMKPVDADGGDVEPAPTQPTIEENVNWLVKAVKAILAFLNIKV
jgi:hypothetical protein